MSNTPGSNAGKAAAEAGEKKPQSTDYTTQQNIERGWKAGGGK